MAIREYGIRELRNHTNDVIEAVKGGDIVYVTRRGERVAELRPVEMPTPMDALLARAAALPKGDSGSLDELYAAKEHDRDVQADRDSASWG